MESTIPLAQQIQNQLVQLMSIPFDAALKQSVGTESVPNEQSAQDTDPQQGYLPDSGLAGDTQKADALLQSFCDEIAPQAKRYAMSIVRHWGDTEEIVQEAFYKLVEKNKKNSTSLVEAGPLSKSLFFAIVRNLAIDRLRKKKRRKFQAVDQQLIPDPKQNVESDRLPQIEKSVEATLNSMPDQWADALKLKINGGLNYEEISKVMDATHGQIRTWIYRARKQLQVELTKQGFFEPNRGLK